MNIEPKVIFEDEEILVLEKPAGITVNRSEMTKGERTVQDWVEERRGAEVGYENFVPSPRSFSSVSPAAGSLNDFVTRSGIVHRLDKETSGILLVAKNQEAFENLQKQFKERRVKKVYTALVHGKVVPSDGEIRVTIGRLPWSRKRFGVVAGGREAITRYRVISNFKFQISNSQEDFSLLELYPETGRTHQIRVHLKHIGSPVFSDPLYAGRKTARDDRKILPRLFLHASKISFAHPKTNQPISFESKLPEDLKKFLTTLRS